MYRGHGSRTHTATRSTAERSERYLRATAATAEIVAMDVEATAEETATTQHAVREADYENYTQKIRCIRTTSATEDRWRKVQENHIQCKHAGGRWHAVVSHTHQGSLAA